MIYSLISLEAENMHFETLEFMNIFINMQESVIIAT